MTTFSYRLICCDCGKVLREDHTKFATGDTYEVICCQACRDKRLFRLSGDIHERCEVMARLLNGGA